VSEAPQANIPGFSIETTENPANVAAPDTVVAVAGELDLETAPLLRQRLHDLIESGHVALTVDLAQLSFLDSTGISVLVEALKLAGRRDGRLVLRAPAPSIRRVLEITGLIELFGLSS
jgi:anti-sigma B factor antagonist